MMVAEDCRRTLSRRPDAKPQALVQHMTRIRVGIVGLGRRWDKQYRAALHGLRAQFEITAVCDQVQQRAEQEAQQLGCAAVTGPAALLEDSTVDALLAIDSQWFRLWPLEMACKLGKPVLCCVSLAADDRHADQLLERVRTCKLPVMMALWPRLAPATIQLRDLLKNHLGPAQLLLCRCPRRAQPASPAPLPSLAVLDWCFSLADEVPRSVLANRAGNITSVLFDLDDGRAIQIISHEVPAFGKSTVDVQVVTERGLARVQLPGRLQWNDNKGEHQHRLRVPRSPAVMILERFAEMIRGQRLPEPTLDDAHRALAWRRAAKKVLSAEC